jgi:hypothetical protein
MVGRPGKQVARKLDVDGSNGGPQRSGTHARGRVAPAFYRQPALAKAVRARPRVGEVAAWARGTAATWGGVRRLHQWSVRAWSA